MTWLTIGAAAAVVLYHGARVALLPPAARRYWLPSRWHRWRWRWLARNCQLAYLDKHHKRVLRPRMPFTTATRVSPDPVYLMRHPRARFRPDPFGWQVNIKLIPGVSRAEFEKAADYLADSWRAHRVGITQPKPGRLQVRAMRRDPLADQVGPDVLTPFDGRHLVLGLDEWGQRRTVSLHTVSGSVIGGSPGRGKTESASSMAVQL